MSKKILVLDNYDSFTYNLVHYVEEITGTDANVFRNNMISLDKVDRYDYIILSPGPGLPKDAGIMPELLKRYASSKKILGICLGHQAIVESEGGILYNLDKVYHGIATPVTVDTRHKMFKGLKEKLDVGRYHSWAVKKENLPGSLEVIASDENGVVMGVQHKKFAVTGVQFHPESILTPEGKTMIKQWLS
ncbi:MAG TPA: aminodeoxychorismate/anthranilate synthase component II [Flavobacteriales bacterium]|nr:aminodeoxychorismate/anthranilate synthase component II [Flavobacteriales bacterium]